jgi:hypothetical protein
MHSLDLHQCIFEYSFNFYTHEETALKPDVQRPNRGSGGRETEMLPGGTWPLDPLMFGRPAEPYDSK